MSRAAGRSIPGHGNIVDKKIRNSISGSVSALAVFWDFSWTLDSSLETSFFEMEKNDLKNSDFLPRSIRSAARTSLRILEFSVKYSIK